VFELEIVEKALATLTKTERRIVEEYLKTRASPKEISRKLGVSVRTVYKALYKYRKTLREEGHDVSHLYLVSARSRSYGNGRRRGSASPPEKKCEVNIEWLREEVRKIIEDYLSSLNGQHDGGRTPDKVPLDNVESAKLLSRIISLLEEINRNLVLLREQITLFSGASETFSLNRENAHPSVQAVNGCLPSYARDNPWLEVLSSRRT